MWALSRKDPAKLDLLLEAPEKVINAVPDDQPDVEGAYFPEATREDFDRQEREDSGVQAWLDRLSRL